MRTLLATLVAVLAAFAPRPAPACTTFLLQQGGEVVVGKSYDWDMGQALLVFNQRGVGKQALVMDPKETPARWRSRFASLTFNQYGRELPNGGMNEAGLVVEVMWLESSVLPPRDARPTVSELQFVQWLLDQYATVAEVVAHARDVRVHRVQGRVHYLACDAGGACAALEHVGGKLVVTSGAALRVPVLTNGTYADSVAFLGKHRGFGGAAAPPAGTKSLARFVRAATLTARGAAPQIPTAAFAILDDVRWGDYTKWNIVYAPRQQRVYWRTRHSPAIKSVDLKPLLATCGSAPVRILDIDAPQAGPANARFVGYVTAANEALLRHSLKEMLPQLPKGTLERLARYPESLPCVPAK
jgi:penicillin V acylase-like amidase (Ntn superfamily)